MHKKFKKNRTKVKDGCQPGKKSGNPQFQEWFASSDLHKRLFDNFWLCLVNNPDNLQQHTILIPQVIQETNRFRWTRHLRKLFSGLFVTCEIQFNHEIFYCTVHTKYVYKRVLKNTDIHPDVIWYVAGSHMNEIVIKCMGWFGKITHCHEYAIPQNCKPEWPIHSRCVLHTVSAYRHKKTHEMIQPIVTWSYIQSLNQILTK